jgi:hypothetical protein
MRLRFIFAVWLVAVWSAARVHAQDTLSPAMPCYADILDDWKDQDNISSQTLGTEINVALGKLATQSSMSYCQYNRENNANKAVDGNTGGDYASFQVTNTGNDYQAWWQVDLGVVYSVDSVRVWNRTDCCADRLSNFDVKLSTDGQTWTNVSNFAGQCGRPSVLNFVAKNARFVRVQLRGTNFLNLAEVEVFAPAKGYRTAIASIIAALPDSTRTLFQTRLNALSNGGGVDTARNNDSQTGSGLNLFNFGQGWSVGNLTDEYAGDDHYSNTTNASCQLQFNGTQAKVYSSLNNNLGITAYSMDGGAETNVDQYAASLTCQSLVFSSPIVSAGTHTLNIRVTGTKNASASNNYASVDRVDVVYPTAADNNAQTVALYVRACSERRKIRIASYVNQFNKVVFSQHNVLGNGTFFPVDIWRAPGYSGKGLELLQMNGYYGNVTHLLPTGEAKSPDISYDGKRILFAWRNGSTSTGQYRLYEMTVADQSVRSITSGSALEKLYSDYADYQGIYLPNNNILFASTRICQQLDCLAGYPVGNFFLCDKDGKYPRRLCNDQVFTDDPCVIPSGEIVYSRWDYNDKAHTYGHAMFIMNPDGTAQREYCNNNSWWPSMILQSRPIPGTTKIMAMIGGYHTPREGKIGIIDVNAGMENGAEVTLLAPVRTPKYDSLDYWGGIPLPNEYPWTWDDKPLAGLPSYPNVRPLDQWGQNPPMFAHPYPLDENAFLVSYRPASKESSWNPRFGLYFMTADNQREMLWYDPSGSCMDAVVLAPRTAPPVLSSSVDYHQTTATMQIMNIYDSHNSQSPVLDGIDPKVIKRIRVAALKFRSLGGIGSANHFCPGCINNGGVGYDTPPATWNACWDVKMIIGETPVLSDGSASFIVPARMPLFLQALDSNGNVVQTMRSWATLQPGETFSCMGCHESRLSPPPPLTYTPLAVKQGAVPLDSFYGPPRLLSFAKEIQPILDAKCVSCHSAANSNGIDLSKTPVWNAGNAKNWSQSYLNLTNHSNEASNSKYVNWFPAEDVPLLQPPYRTGACKSPLIPLLAQGHHNVVLTKKETDLIRCWIDFSVPFGDYIEGMSSQDSATTAHWDSVKAVFQKEDLANIAAYAATVGTVRRPNGYGQNPDLISQKWAFAAQSRAKRSIVVEFSVPDFADRTSVRVSMYTLQGRLAGTLLNDRVSKGMHVYRFNLKTLAGGHYVLTMKAQGYTGTQHIVEME